MKKYKPEKKVLAGYFIFSSRSILGSNSALPTKNISVLYMYTHKDIKKQINLNPFCYPNIYWIPSRCNVCKAKGAFIGGGYIREYGHVFENILYFRKYVKCCTNEPQTIVCKTSMKCSMTVPEYRNYTMA